MDTGDSVIAGPSSQFFDSNIERSKSIDGCLIARKDFQGLSLRFFIVESDLVSCPSIGEILKDIFCRK
jgi:hypothetical protein